MKRGFTLVELLIVVIIIAVLATIAIPKFADSSRRAKEARLKLFLYSVRNATERYHNDVGLWPMSADLLNGVTPTQGYTNAGVLTPVPAGTYFGPYFDIEKFDVGISGVTLAYTISGAALIPVGSWRLAGAVRASDGTLFSSW